MNTQRHSVLVINFADLERFCDWVRDAARDRAADTVYLTGSLRLTLTETELTDGSTVFDIEPALVLDNKRRAR